jgi:hypothetical protein
LLVAAQRRGRDEHARWREGKTAELAPRVKVRVLVEQRLSLESHLKREKKRQDSYFTWPSTTPKILLHNHKSQISRAVN